MNQKKPLASLTRPKPGYKPYLFLSDAGKLAYIAWVKLLGDKPQELLRQQLAALDAYFAEYAARRNDKIRPYTSKTTGDLEDFSDENAESISGRYAAVKDLLRADKRAQALDKMKLLHGAN